MFTKKNGYFWEWRDGSAVNRPADSTLGHVISRSVCCGQLFWPQTPAAIYGQDIFCHLLWRSIEDGAARTLIFMVSDQAKHLRTVGEGAELARTSYGLGLLGGPQSPHLRDIWVTDSPFHIREFGSV